MNFYQTMKKIIGRSILPMIVALPVAVSCYDDSAVRGEINDIEEQLGLLVDKVLELEQQLNGEIRTLKDLLAGKILINDVSTNASNGITTVTLSNGVDLQLRPEKDLQSYVTYITLSDGVDYWGYIDANGKKQLFLDEDGKPLPVLSETPEVVVKDNETYLVIGGVEYPLSGNSVFSDYEVIVDELTGEVYAVTFTFGDDMTFTVTVDGACGFHFVVAKGWSTEVIDNYYVAYGLTERVQIDAKGVVDYVLQIPDGWRVKEIEDIYMGQKYFDITAPAEELVESGAAAAEGELKVVAVLEGGKATVAKLFLSTEPFKYFGVSMDKASTEMYNGLQKFVYGVCKADEFDEQTILNTASELLTAYEYPAGYGVADHDLDEISVEEIAGAELVVGEEYVFWALPALYYATMDYAGYYVKEGTFESVRFSHCSVKFEISDIKFRDAHLSLELEGVDGYYLEVDYADGFMPEDVVALLNAGYYTEKTTSGIPYAYEGSLFDMPSVSPAPATAYVAWFAIAKDGTYTEDDLLTIEFSTLDLTAGSDVKIVADDPVLTAVEAQVTLTAEGAEKIYYTYLTESNASIYADDESKAMYLFENGIAVEGDNVVAKLSDTNLKKSPKTKYVLFAVATDAEGKFGEVLTLECTTTEITYNDLQVKMEMVLNDPGNVVLSISADGAEGFLYWIGKTSDNTWKSSNFLGGSAEKAQEYMYLNSSHNRLVTVMEKYPVIDGMITMNDLQMDVEHVIVAMAKDKSGLYSKAVAFKFVPMAVAIGKVVPASDPKWAAARPTIDFIPEKFVAGTGQMHGSYAFNVTVPTGFTGYVLAGTDTYLNEGDESTVLTIEEKIVKIINYVDASRDVDLIVDYDAFGNQGWPHGAEFYHNEHGNPLFGNAIIWANQEFHDSLCDCGGNFSTNRVVSGVEVEVKHEILINDGKPVEFRQPYAVGSKTEVVDRVFVICQDLDGNCYEAFEYDVPVEYFQNAGERDEQ